MQLKEATQYGRAEKQPTNHKQQREETKKTCQNLKTSSLSQARIHNLCVDSLDTRSVMNWLGTFYHPCFQAESATSSTVISNCGISLKHYSRLSWLIFSLQTSMTPLTKNKTTQTKQTNEEQTKPYPPQLLK